MAGFVNAWPAVPTVLSVATAVNFSKGVPGTAGVANDTLVLAVTILLNAAAVTLTFNSGFRDETKAQNTTAYILTGSTGVDTHYLLNWLNSAGPLQVTASVANKVIIETMASGLIA